MEYLFLKVIHMHTLDNREVGRRLLEKRLQVTESSRKFAMDAGVDPSHYAKIEKGDLPITEKILNKLVNVYNLDQSYILYGKTIPNYGSEHVRLVTEEPHVEYGRYQSPPPPSKDPMAIIAELVAQNKTLVNNNERLTISNEKLVDKALISLGEILKASLPFEEEEKDQHDSVQQTDALDKPKIRYRVNSGKRRGSVGSKGK